MNKSSRMKRTLQWGVCLAMGASSLLAKELKFPFEYRTQLNVPKSKNAPVIDGVIGVDEWKTSTQIRGMVGHNKLKLLGREVCFYLSWDENNLYLAAKSDIRPGEALMKNKREPRSLAVVFDDSYEFGIDLRGANQAVTEEAFFSKVVLNAFGAGEYQKIYPLIGQSIYNWNPEMEIANREVVDESGTRWWEMEVAMDLKDLQMPRAFKAGDRLGINMSRNFKNPWIFSNVPTPTGYLVSRGFPEVTLVEDDPFIQVKKCDGFLDGDLNFEATISNPSQREISCTAKMTVHSQEGRFLRGDKVIFDQHETFVLAPGETKSFVVDRKVHDKKGFADFRVEKIGAESEENPIYKYHFAFEKDDQKKFLTYTGESHDFPLEVNFNPVTQKLWLAGDTLDAKLKDGQKADAMSYRIQGEDGWVREGRITRMTRHKFRDVIDLQGLKPGRYEAECSLLCEHGDVLLKRTLSFEEADESQKFAEWWDNEIGIPNKVMRPFESITVQKTLKNTIVSPVLRQVHLNALGLPRSIIARGEDVMASPARVVLVVDGRTISSDAAGTVKITKVEDHEVRFKGDLELGGLVIKTEGVMEQDGLVDITMTYEPIGGQTVHVQEFRLEFPIDDTWNNHMVVIGNGGNYAVRKIGEVPEGHGVVWDTLKDLGLQGSAMTQGNFYGNLWLGTEKRGFLWAGDSDEGWVPSNTSPSHSLLRDAGAVVLRNHIISTQPDEKPFDLSAKREIRFQYNASPFRPLDRGFRVNSRSAGNGFGAIPGYMLNDKLKKPIKGWTLLHPPTPNKEEWPEWYANWKVKADELNGKGLYDVIYRQKSWNNTQIALRGYDKKSIEPGVYEYFKSEWMPQGSGDELLTKSYRDYMHHLMQRMVSEGNMQQFYYDISFASKIYHNLTGGHGYFLPDGRIQPETNDDELRAFFKRSYAMMTENGVYPTGVSCHATNSFCLKAMPYVDAVLDSEYPMKDPIDTFPSARMIAMSVPHAFGVGINHLPQMNARWAALHDASTSGASSRRKYTFDSPVLKHWGITAEDVQFIPYWRNSDVVEHISHGMKVSLWKRSDRLLLGVVNYGKDKPGFEKARTLGLQLKLDALGVPDGLSASDCRIEEVLVPKGAQALSVLDLNGKTGQLNTSALAYHDIRFFTIHWDATPVPPALSSPPTLALKAKNWGFAEAVEALDAIGLSAEGIQSQAWKRPESALFKFANTTDRVQNVTVAIDLEALGIGIDAKNERWLRFYQAMALEEDTRVQCVVANDPQHLAAKAALGEALFDGHQSLLQLHLKPGQKMVFSLDRI